MNRKIATFAILTLLVCTSGFSYVEQVHRKISKRAFDLLLSQRDILKEYGIDPSRRDALQSELADGAEEEDGALNPLNHFFDPVHDAPLTIEVPTFNSMDPPVITGISCTTVLGNHTAKDWALHATSNSNGLDAAKDLFHDALTSGSSGSRDDAWADLFNTLGHIIHLIQDMAQPEHTRNDQHLSFGPSYGDRAPSLYENWTRDNLVGDSTFNGQSTESFFGNYPVVTFLPPLPPPDVYFTSGGLGLADYSNANFVTQDTNYGDYAGVNGSFHCYSFSAPNLILSTKRDQYATATVYNAKERRQEQVEYIDTIYTRPMYDYFLHTLEADSFHTIESLVDYESLKFNASGPAYFSLDDECYSSHAAYLLPKAVGYSAGFLDSFFPSSVLYVTWKKDSKDGDWTPTLINYGDAVENAQVEVLQGDLKGSLSPIGSPVSMFLDRFSGGPVNVPPQSGDFIYNSDRRIVVTGTVDDVPRTIYFRDQKKNAKIEVQFLYDTADGTDQASLSVFHPTGEFPESCPGCTSLTSHWFTGAGTATVDQYIINTQNTWLSKAPFNGEVDAEIGAASDDKYWVGIGVHPKSARTVRGAVTIKLDGQQIYQDIFNYHGLTSNTYKIDVAASSVTKDP